MYPDEGVEKAIISFLPAGGEPRLGPFRPAALLVDREAGVFLILAGIPGNECREPGPRQTLSSLGEFEDERPGDPAFEPGVEAASLPEMFCGEFFERVQEVIIPFRASVEAVSIFF